MYPTTTTYISREEQETILTAYIDRRIDRQTLANRNNADALVMFRQTAWGSFAKMLNDTLPAESQTRQIPELEIWRHGIYCWGCAAAASFRNHYEVMYAWEDALTQAIRAQPRHAERIEVAHARQREQSYSLACEGK